MTSQIAILSMFGAAVASDTVVTSHSRGQRKVTPNTSKVIELGPDHKVLVLNSGNLYLNNYPHEIQIKEWAKTLPGPLPTLASYVQSYEDWAASETKFSTQASVTAVLEKLAYEAYDLASDLVETERQEMEPADFINSRKRNICDKKTLEWYLDFWEAKDDFAAISRAKLRSQLGENSLVRSVVEESNSHTLMPLSKSNKLLLEKVIEVMIGKQFLAEGFNSTLGFIGFGADEPFPGYVILDCRGVYAGGLMATKTSWKITEDNPGRIQYFAQHRSMKGIIDGIHPDMFTRVMDEFKDLASVPLVDNTSLVETFKERLEEASYELFINPLFDNLGAYSILEMTDLADRLVGIEVLSSSIFRDDISTVGGTIEVASIDSEKGVLWHRKLPSTKLNN